MVGDPERMDDLGARLRASFDGRLFIAKSLPEFLEVAEPDVSKGSGLHWVCEHLGIDGRRTSSPSETTRTTASCCARPASACAAGDADPTLAALADFAVPGPAEDGVARFLQRAGRGPRSRLGGRMIDAKLLRSDTDRVRAALARRGAADEVDAFLELDGKRRDAAGLGRAVAGRRQRGRQGDRRRQAGGPRHHRSRSPSRRS